MKAVLLAGGLGTRMREETEFRPKPMVEVGGKPVLWHIMKILSSQGIKEFIVCTGYKSEHIANYFANYGAVNKDFTVNLGDHSSIVYHGEHEELDWTVTVAYTGADTMTSAASSACRRTSATSRSSARTATASRTSTSSRFRSSTVSTDGSRR